MLSSASAASHSPSSSPSSSLAASSSRAPPRTTPSPAASPPSSSPTRAIVQLPSLEPLGDAAQARVDAHLQRRHQKRRLLFFGRGNKKKTSAAPSADSVLPLEAERRPSSEDGPLDLGGEFSTPAALSSSASFPTPRSTVASRAMPSAVVVGFLDEGKVFLMGRPGTTREDRRRARRHAAGGDAWSDDDEHLPEAEGGGRPVELEECEIESPRLPAAEGSASSHVKRAVRGSIRRAGALSGRASSNRRSFEWQEELKKADKAIVSQKRASLKRRNTGGGGSSSPSIGGSLDAVPSSSADSRSVTPTPSTLSALYEQEPTEDSGVAASSSSASSVSGQRRQQQRLITVNALRPSSGSQPLALPQPDCSWTPLPDTPDSADGRSRPAPGEALVMPSHEAALNLLEEAPAVAALDVQRAEEHAALAKTLAEETKVEGVVPRSGGQSEPVPRGTVVWERLWENQRGILWFGSPRFSSSSLLPMDPSPFTREGATRRSCKTPYNLGTFQLPDATWHWAGEWMINMRRDGETDEKGWEYNSYFHPTGWHAVLPWHGWKGWVRRRQWIRLRMHPPPPRTADLPRALADANAVPQDSHKPSPFSPQQQRHRRADVSRGEGASSQGLGVDAATRVLGSKALDRERLDIWRTWLENEDDGWLQKLIEHHLPALQQTFVHPSGQDHLRSLLCSSRPNWSLHEPEFALDSRGEEETRRVRANSREAKVSLDVKGKVVGVEVE